MFYYYDARSKVNDFLLNPRTFVIIDFYTAIQRGVRERKIACRKGASRLGLSRDVI
jgi:hypothetical protein